MEATLVQGVGKGKGKKNGSTVNGTDPSTNYEALTPLPSGQERAFCQEEGACFGTTLVCPEECPERKPRRNKKDKGCFIDCSSKCEATCKCKYSSHYMLIREYLKVF